MQIGALADARRVFYNLMAVVDDPAVRTQDLAEPEATRHDYLGILERAARYAELACVVSAADASDDPKYRERTRRFRMEKD